MRQKTETQNINSFFYEEPKQISEMTNYTTIIKTTTKNREIELNYTETLISRSYDCVVRRGLGWKDWHVMDHN